jgi:hypothetical protein
MGSLVRWVIDPNSHRITSSRSQQNGLLFLVKKKELKLGLFRLLRRRAWNGQRPQTQAHPRPTAYKYSTGCGQGKEALPTWREVLGVRCRLRVWLQSEQSRAEHRSGCLTNWHHPNAACSCIYRSQLVWSGYQHSIALRCRRAHTKLRNLLLWPS